MERAKLVELLKGDAEHRIPPLFTFSSEHVTTDEPILPLYLSRILQQGISNMMFLSNTSNYRLC